MKWSLYWQEALQNLYFSKLRSLLALIGILVGTASVVAMVLGGELATQETLKQFQSLGTDLLAISINTQQSDNPDAAGRTSTVTLESVNRLSMSSNQIISAAPYAQVYMPVSYEGQSITSVILGVTDIFPAIIHLELQSGRFISLLDNYESYAVIGHHLYESLKTISYKEPLGQQIQIGKNIFRIIGVAKPWPENGFIYANMDNSIMVPILASTVLSKYASINNVIAKLKPDADIDQTEQRLTDEAVTSLPDKEITYRSAKELITKMKNQSAILTLFLGLIGSISLLVGGIGVMNIMLVSVIERKKEIGIRLAVGATPGDIAVLFLIESILLSLIGGCLGVMIGMLIAYILALMWHWSFTFFFWPPVAGFMVSALTGIFFGFYPALKAARLDPIEGLRAE